MEHGHGAASGRRKKCTRSGGSRGGGGFDEEARAKVVLELQDTFNPPPCAIYDHLLQIAAGRAVGKHLQRSPESLPARGPYARTRLV